MRFETSFSLFNLLLFVVFAFFSSSFRCRKWKKKLVSYAPFLRSFSFLIISFLIPFFFSFLLKNSFTFNSHWERRRGQRFWDGFNVVRHKKYTVTDAYLRFNSFKIIWFHLMKILFVLILLFASSCSLLWLRYNGISLMHQNINEMLVLQ